MTEQLHFSALWPHWPELLAGLWVTIQLTVLATIGGLTIGIFGAAIRSGRPTWFSRIWGGYVELIRNTPFVVQLFFIVFGLPNLGLKMTAGEAALLAMVQMVCCLALVLLSQRLSKAIPTGSNNLTGWRDPQDSLHSRVADFMLIALALLLLLPPLLAVIVDGLNRNVLSVLQQPVLWQATWTSLRIALAAGLLCVILTMMLLWSSRELYARHARKAGHALELTGMLILAMPGIVLATGFFLLFNSTIGLPESADGIVIFTNALMAIPYALKVLENPMRDVNSRYSLLCQSLGMQGWKRLKVVELRALKRPLAQALAFACVLSIGDFGVVALFGNEDFRTLPFWLYQQIGSYRSQDGAVTALLLLVLCFALFTVIEKLPGRDVKTD